MATDIASIINQLTNAAQQDASIVDKLDANPIALIEKLTGIDLPDEMLAPILSGFQANLNAAPIQATDSATGAPIDLLGLATSALASEGLDVDGDGDVDLDDLKAGIMGALL